MPIPKKSQPEVWKSNILGELGILKLDRRGELVHEVVRGGQKLTITPEERLLNQDKAADQSLDVFMNGTLSPVRLIEDAEGYAEIANNPNLLSESDLRAVFKLKAADFRDKLEQINNGTTLRRLLDTAEEEDASIRVVNAIRARLETVDPPRFVERPSQGGGGDHKPNPVTPK